MLKLNSMRVLAIAAGLLLAGGIYAARATGEEYVFDVRAGRTLVMLIPGRELAVRDGATLTPLGLPVYSAKFLPNGDIAAVDIDLALWRIGPGGRTAWLPPGSINAPLFISPDGRLLAYTKPNDHHDGSTFPLTNGIAVLDLETGQERLLLELPGLTLGLYGWLGGDLVIEVPTWDPQTLRPPDMLTLARLPADGSGPAQRLAELPRLEPDSTYPQTSFDQRFLSYQSLNGVVVMSLSDASYAEFAGQSDPLWTPAGLTTSQAGARSTLAWSPQGLTSHGAASGPLALPLPDALPPNDAGLSPNAGIESETAVLFYRPVVPAVRISSHFDLEPAIGLIRDIYGWVTGGWRPPRAYDNHRGTDYASPLGTPVYASATGTVDLVRIQCGNFYQGGPAGFGSYVRINHGQMSDGNSYRTLYGHLKCDGVHIVTGTVVSTLPTYLGEMGSTGTSTGPHVHLEVYRNGVSVDPYDLRIISDNPAIRITGDLAGLVVDHHGQPAAGALVKLTTGGANHPRLTGADGAYAYTDMPGGSARLTAVRGRRWGVLNTTVLADQSITLPNLALANCRGAVTASDGCPALTFDAASFVTDVTIPDGMTVTAGLSLTKTWRLRNTGALPWAAGYELVFVSGEPLPGAPPAVPAPPAAPGAEADLTVTFLAPAAEGAHRSYWRMRSSQGVYFGPTIWLEIKTQPAAQAAQDRPASPPGNMLAASTQASCQVSAPAASASAFTVSWSGSSPSGLSSFDVQFLDSGRGLWRPWLIQAPVSRTSAVFAGQLGHFYQFRCRAADATNTPGSFSDGSAVTFVTAASGAPDLTILSLTAEPAPGGGMLARAVIRNQGPVGTTNGFFTDLYLDHVPIGVGDYTGSAHTWVSEPLAAGATVTLTTVLAQTSGTRNAVLYAQVDSTNGAPESNEDNNRFTAGVSVCLAAEDSYEDDDAPAGAKLLSPGASQARNFGWPGDPDWILLNLQAGRFYVASTAGLGAGVDTVLTLFGPDGLTPLAANDDLDNVSPASRLPFGTLGAGPYYLLVENWNPAAGGCGAAYTVSLANLGPAHFVFFPAIGR